MPKYLSIPSPWFKTAIKQARELDADGDSIGAQLVRQKIELEKEYLKESIKLLRKHYTGYEAKDGYSLKDVVKLPADRLNKVKKYAPRIRAEISSPFVEVRPRSTRTRESVARFAGIDSAELRGKHRRKIFVVHDEKPETAKVRLVTRTHVTRIKTKGKTRTKKTQHVNVEISHVVKGGQTADRYFLFTDYSAAPVTTFEDVEELTRKMLRFMPNGYYVFVSSRFGSIHATMKKQAILRQIRDYFLDYDKLPGKGIKDNRGLAETLTGYKLVSTTAEGASKFSADKQTRGELLRSARAARRAAERRKVMRRLYGRTK